MFLPVWQCPLSSPSQECLWSREAQKHRGQVCLPTRKSDLFFFEFLFLFWFFRFHMRDHLVFHFLFLTHFT